MTSGGWDAFKFSAPVRKIAPKRVVLVLDQLSKVVGSHQFLRMATQGESVRDWEQEVADAIESGKLEELEARTVADLQLFIDLLRDGVRKIDVLERDPHFVFVYNSAITIANYRSQQEAEKEER